MVLAWWAQTYRERSTAMSKLIIIMLATVKLTGFFFPESGKAQAAPGWAEVLQGPEREN